ncbi:MAG: signal recognition particle protein [Gammaproteobacteria bacterium]
MCDNLSQRLQQTIKRLRGEGRLTDDNMRDALRDVRLALLEADVALPVVKTFIERVRTRAAGQDVIGSLTPGQALIKIVHDELVALMGTANNRLDLATRPPAVVLFAGLQGAGKTTTVAKLARMLRTREQKTVLVTSADVYRPAAIDQLRKLAHAVEVEFAESDPKQKPVDIARAAVDAARKRVIDVVLIDTAGRLHVDAEMMDEIKAIHAAIQPVETLFVVDSMAGQDAVNAARAFNEALPLTGVILTKADGDARGGAALSVREVTGKPIKFLGVGEATDALEPFHPDRLASRILGMGDVLTLVEEAHRSADRDKAEKIAQKLRKGKDFDLEDFRDQLQQMEKMGGVASLLDKLPGAGQMPANAKDQINDKQMKRLVAIINSMTPAERRTPDIIRGSRKRRIAAGSGTEVQEVNRLLKQFDQMQRVMKQMRKGGGLQRMMQSMKGRFPGMP